MMPPPWWLGVFVVGWIGFIVVGLGWIAVKVWPMVCR